MTTGPAFWRFLPDGSAPDAATIRAAGVGGKGALARTLREARERLGVHRAGALLRNAESECRFGRPFRLTVATSFQTRPIEDALRVAFAIAGLAVDVEMFDGFPTFAGAIDGASSPQPTDMVLLVRLGDRPQGKLALLAGRAADRLGAPVVIVRAGADRLWEWPLPEGVEAIDVLPGEDAVDRRFGATFGDLPTAEVADRIADAAAGTAARSIGEAPKVIVTDLDGTLWSGLIGEDGPAGLALHEAFTHELKQAASRGLILGIASRNDPRDVEAIFAARPEWPLRRDDFAAAAVGWEEKDALVATVLRRLSLDPRHAVVIDDDPVNCARLAASLPDADVRHFAGDPDAFAAMLRSDPLLAGAGHADVPRAEAYRRREAVERLRAEAADVGSFLRQLETRVTVVPLVSAHHRRAAELAARVNQFALADFRPSAMALAARDSDFDRLFRLDDAFGAHGFVGLVLARPDGDALRVDNLFLSCRALGREIEVAMIAALCGMATRAGLARVEGPLQKLPRNEPARRAFSRYLSRDDDLAWSIDAQSEPLEREDVTLLWDRTTT